MSRQVKRRRSEIVQSSKLPSNVAVLAELLRLTEQAGTMEVSRDYFRANSRFRDKWNMYWPSFKAFLAARMAGDDLYYKALVEFVTTVRGSTHVSGSGNLPGQTFSLVVRAPRRGPACSAQRRC
jgi:hypothetical protein